MGRSFLKPFHALGIEPIALVPESAALANLFEDWKAKPPSYPENTPVSADEVKVYLSYEMSFVLIFSQNRLIHVYDLNWGIESCIADTAAKYKRSLSQALDYFLENAFITQEEQPSKMLKTIPLSKITKRAVSSLERQLNLLLIHLKSSHNIKKITLLGPAAQIQNLSSHLFNIFKIPVHSDSNPFAETNTSLNFSVTPPTKYELAFACALEGFKGAKNPPVNLLPKSKAEGVLSISPKKKKFLKTAAMALIVLLSYTLVRQWQSQQLSEKAHQIFSSYARKTAGLKTREISISNIKKFLNTKKNIYRKNTTYKTLSTIPSALNQIKIISQAISNPDQWKLEISQMEVNGSSVRLQGFADQTKIESLKTNLKSIALKNSFQDQSKKLKTKAQPKKRGAEKQQEKNQNTPQKQTQQALKAQKENSQPLDKPTEESTEKPSSTTGSTDQTPLKMFYFTFKLKG